jgi:hypothetical protein
MNDGALGVVGHGNPVTDGRAIDTGELVAEPAGDLPEPGLTAEQVISPGPVGGNPGRNEIWASLFEAVELLREKRSKSEIFKFKNNQHLAPG